MILDPFEWDDAKAASNLAKHQVDFQDAITAFDDPHAVLIPDHRHDYGEHRLNLLGRMPGDAVVLIICFVSRTRIRIISARPASRRERRHYSPEAP